LAHARLVLGNAAVLIGIERLEEPIAGFPRVDAEAVGRVGITGDGALILGPLHERSGPRRPALDLRAFRTGIRLVAKVEQTDVAEGLRPEAANLDVVFQHGEWFGKPIR